MAVTVAPTQELLRAERMKARAEQRAAVARMRLEAKVAGVKEKRYEQMSDLVGRGGRKAYSSSYATSVSTRLRNGATPMQGSADDHLDAFTRAKLRLVSQDLLRTSPTARAAFNRLSVSVTGPNGLSFQGTSKDGEWNKKVEAWVENWWEHRFDARGMMGRVEAQDMILRSVWRDGDLLLLKLVSGSCQVIEGERIGSGMTSPTATDDLVEGVKLDAAGRAVAYRVSKKVRGRRSYSDAETVTVDAQNCVFLVNPRGRWSSQTRGEPLLSALIQVFEDMTESQDATVIAMRMAAMLAMVIYMENPADSQNAALGELTSAEAGPSGSSQREEVLSPGTIKRLKVGEKVETVQSGHPGPQFESFMRMMLRQIGAEMDLPLEMLALDFSVSNFYGNRAAMIMAWLSIGRTQGWLGRRCLSPITLWAVENAIEDGELTGAPADWKMHKWVAAPMPAIDEKESYLAKGVAVALKLKSHKQAVEELGGDQEELLEQIQREQAEMAAKGIVAAMPQIVIVPNDLGKQGGQDVGTQDQATTGAGN